MVGPVPRGDPNSWSRPAAWSNPLEGEVARAVQLPPEPRVSHGGRELRGIVVREVAHDPDLALFGGHDGLDAFRRFLPGVGCYLEPGGWLALEIGANQGPEVTAMAKGSGLDPVLLADDLSGNPRFVFAQRA